MKHLLTNQDNARLIAILIAAAIALVATSYVLGSHAEFTKFTDPQVRLQRARSAFLSGEYRTAFAMFEPLAKSGNARAQFWLADMYEYGYGVKKNVPTAIDWLTKAADQGLTRAEARLGEIYLAGDETVQDFAKASTWLSKAGMKGDKTSERYLGHDYELGLGVPRDQIEAYAWYENAVLSGDGLAVRLRDELVGHMISSDIAKAQERAKDLQREIRRPS